MSFVELDLRLPREAFAPSEIARAGALWRLLQDAAVRGSSALGWPPERYVAEQCAFVVRRMVVTHHRSPRFGEPLPTATWVSSMRRDTFTTREIRVSSPEGPVVSTTQSWVHVAAPSLRPGRASRALLDALAVEDRAPSVALPEPTPAEGPEHRWSFATWHTWMDPLAHANHPAYVDWADEALAQRMSEAGIDPHAIEPVAEDLLFRSGVVAPERVTVATQLVGTSPDDPEVAVVRVAVLGGDDRVCAEGTVWRRGVLAALTPPSA